MRTLIQGHIINIWAGIQVRSVRDWVLLSVVLRLMRMVSPGSGVRGFSDHILSLLFFSLWMKNRSLGNRGSTASMFQSQDWNLCPPCTKFSLLIRMFRHFPGTTERNTCLFLVWPGRNTAISSVNLCYTYLLLLNFWTLENSLGLCTWIPGLPSPGAHFLPGSSTWSALTVLPNEDGDNLT